MQQVPDKFKQAAVATLVAGLFNFFIGGAVVGFAGSIGGGTCTGILTLGLCPAGFLCGLLGPVIGLFGLIQAIIGGLALGNPDSVKGFLGYLAFLQMPALLIGDIASPIAGIMNFMAHKDPNVRAYIEG